MMMLSLAPISEERNVSFAGINKYAYYDVKGERKRNSYAAVALDAVKVKFIPHVSEYSRADKHNIWYTTVEVNAMKQTAFHDIDVRKEEMKSNSNNNNNDNNKRQQYQQQQQQQHQHQYTGDVRGLERLIYNDVNDCRTRRYKALRAVLQEQYYQRCWRIYSVNNNTGDITNDDDDDDDRNDERIRQACMAKGETIRSQERAQRLAQQDEADVKEYLQLISEEEEFDEEEDDDDRADTDTTYFNTRQRQRQQPIIGKKNRRKGKPSSSNECCWCVDVVDVVGRSLLLHAVLKPFIKMRHGDTFLD